MPEVVCTLCGLLNGNHEALCPGQSSYLTVPGKCPECGHPWSEHDQLLKGAGKMLLPEYNPDGVVDLYECDHYAGMGDWCGCEERSRQPLRKPSDTLRDAPQPSGASGCVTCDRGLTKPGHRGHAITQANQPSAPVQTAVEAQVDEWERDAGAHPDKRSVTLRLHARQIRAALAQDKETP